MINTSTPVSPSAWSLVSGDALKAQADDEFAKRRKRLEQMQQPIGTGLSAANLLGLTAALNPTGR